MSNQVLTSKKKTVSSVSLKCSNKSFVDSLIDRYSAQVKSAVEHTIEMCKTVTELHDAQKNGTINDHDVDYFCMSVKLRKNSSQYRKFICIGSSYDLFKQYIDRVPQAISVLYEITTIDPDKFIQLIDNNLIDQSTTLHKLKLLAGKPVTNFNSGQDKHALTIDFELDKISQSTAKTLFDFYTKLKSNNEVKIESTQITTLQKLFEESNIVDFSVEDEVSYV